MTPRYEHETLILFTNLRLRNAVPVPLLSLPNINHVTSIAQSASY